MSTDNNTPELLRQLLQRADALLLHLQHVQSVGSLAQPDWAASVAFRYRRSRTGAAQLVPVAHVAPIALSDLQEIDDQKEKYNATRSTLCAVCPPITCC